MNGTHVSIAPVQITTTAHNTTTNTTVTVDNYNPYAYDPNFTYLINATDYKNLTSSIRVWTTDQLLSGISAGLLTQTTSTQVNIEAPNITASNISIVASGNIGTLINPVTNQVGFVPGQTLLDGSPAQLALGAAARTDLNFLSVQPGQVTVNFGVNSSGDGTMTLVSAASLVNGASTSNPSWSDVLSQDGVHTLGLAAGQQIFIGGSTQNATENGQYLTILSVSGSVVTFVPGEKIVTETSQTILTAPIIVTTDQSTLGATTTKVNFNSSNNTITLAGGGSWSTLGYAVGQGIFVGSATDPNGNGASYNVSSQNYYRITAINGATLTVQGSLAATESNVTIDLSPITIGAVVNFGNFGSNGTITLADGASWTGYTVGEGIFVGSSSGDLNANGVNFNAGSSNPYYTITQINGSTISVSGNLPVNTGAPLAVVETGATVDLAPVNINVNIHGNSIKYVLISQNKDVAIAPSGTLTASAGGFIFLGSQDTLDLETIVAGTTNNPANARIKTQANIVNVAGAGVANLQGQQLTLEAGQGAIGTSSAPVTVDIVGSFGSLTARALNNIYITAPKRQYSGRRDLFGCGWSLSERSEWLDLRRRRL